VGTVDILEHINAVYSGVQLSLILGTDTFYDLMGGKWKRWQDILEIAALHVFSRSKPVPLCPFTRYTAYIFIYIVSKY
jgi:nicotinic acid mononucleotide adenylyltransferase